MTWDESGKLVQKDYEDGHKLIDNGVGDYDLICPDMGKIGFIPVLCACTLDGKLCYCGKKLKESKND